LAFEKTIEQIASGVVRPTDFNTGSALFDAEWVFGTYLMAGFGTAQQMLVDGHDRDARLARLHRCIDMILSDEVRAFTTRSWGSDPLESLDRVDQQHGAYLGYLNVLLGLERALDPASPHAKIHDRITASLVRRMEAHPLLIVQTYPGEAYPVDMCAVVASLALHQAATGVDHHRVIERWRDVCNQYYRHRDTGLLFQAVDFQSGKPSDYPRGSGTALGAYFLSLMDPALSLSLYESIKKHLLTPEGPMQGVREYLDPALNHRVDIDSGPILMGLGTSATGFTVGLARCHGDTQTLKNLLGLSYVLGNPQMDETGAFRYVVGYPLSSSIMYAMLTARPVHGTVP